MKKIPLVIILITLLLINFNVASADTPTTTNNGMVVLENPVGANNVWEIINRIINLMFTISLYAGLALIIWAGWTIITSQGNSEKVAGGTKIITSVLIGIVVILLARFIISVVYYVVTGKPGGVPNLNKTTTNYVLNNQKILTDYSSCK